MQAQYVFTTSQAAVVPEASFLKAKKKNGETTLHLINKSEHYA